MPKHDHHKAAQHHDEAAKSHRDAAKAHEEGDSEQASQHSLLPGGTIHLPLHSHTRCLSRIE